MKQFTSIEQFRHVVKSIHMHYEYIGKLNELPTIDFIGTAKLHGTNAGIRRSPSGKITAQSKTRLISPTDDNYGFAKFIEAIPPEVLHLELFDKVAIMGDDITIYGEWIGKGIQGATGVGKLEKQWVIFGASVNDTYVPNKVEWCSESYNIYNIMDIEPYCITIDFNDPEASIEPLQTMTLGVEEQCPWAKKFDVEGIGEGIVWVRADMPSAHDYWFKIKGQKHSGEGKNKKEMVTIDPQVVENISQCVDIILTEGRLKQGLEYLKEENLEVEMRNMGKYLKWVGQDTQKEELDTVVANGLEWNDVSKVVIARSKKFFMDEINKWD